MKKWKIILMTVLAMVLACATAIAEPTALYAVEGEELVLFEKDGIKLYLTGTSDATSNCFNLNVIVVIETDQLLDITYTGVANGWSMSSNYSIVSGDIQPQSKAKGNLWFMFDDYDITSYADLEELRLTFTVRDSSTNDKLFVEDVGSVYFNTEAPAPEEQPAESIAEAPAEAATEPIILFGSYEMLEVGSKGDAVRQLQQALIDQGFLEGGADGVYGNGTASGVSKFQESAGLEATGVADEETQRQLFGGVDVLAALKEEIWYFNGGEDTVLNAMAFGDSATITQFVFDGNGRHENAKNDYAYTLDESSITVTLIDGSELVIPYAVQGGGLLLDGGNYCSSAQVNAGLQGYWKTRYSMTFEGIGTGAHEEHVYFGNGVMRFEHASEALNGAAGQYYYYGPYEASYTLGVGSIEADIKNGDYFSFNIIDGKPALILFSRVFESTDEKFPGKNGYDF